MPQRTTTGFAFYTIDRAIKEGLARRKFGQNEAQQVLDFFGIDPPECVYCGSKDMKRWDHLVAISTGGETIIGNIVPACSQCDDSKGKSDYKEWMNSNAQYSPKTQGTKNIKQKIKRIDAYMKHFNYSPRDIEERLTQSERKRKRDIERKLQGIRADIEKFISDYRNDYGL